MTTPSLFDAPLENPAPWPPSRPSVTAVAPAETRGPRWFVRCTGCLTIAAINEPPNCYDWQCSICQGAIESMGKVQRDRLVHEHMGSSCDDGYAAIGTVAVYPAMRCVEEPLEVRSGFLDFSEAFAVARRLLAADSRRSFSRMRSIRARRSSALLRITMRGALTVPGRQIDRCSILDIPRSKG